MKKILLTGGMGYIGSHTALELMKNNYEPIILDNLFNSKEEVLTKIEKITGQKPKFYHADLLNAAQTQEILQTEHPDAVIHFAGLKAVAESVEKPLLYYRTNILATLNLLNAMQKTGVNRLIFSSSATVYGDHEISPSGLAESDPTGQGITNPYGQTKFMIERIIQDYVRALNAPNQAPNSSNFQATILRYFNPVGCDPSGLLGEDPNGRPNNLIPIVAKVYTGNIPELTIFGNDYKTKDGTCERDFIHVSDLAKGHLAALEHMQDGVNVYNLGTGKPNSVLEIVHAFEQAAGQKLPCKFGPRRPGDLPVLFANAEKAKRELNWVAEKTITDAATDLVKYLGKAAAQ